MTSPSSLVGPSRSLLATATASPYAGVRLLTAGAPVHTSTGGNFDFAIKELNGQIFGYGALVTLVTMAFFGVAPALLAFQWGLWEVPRVGMAVAFSKAAKDGIAQPGGGDDGSGTDVPVDPSDETF